MSQRHSSTRHSLFARVVSLTVACALTLGATPILASDREAASAVGSLNVVSDPVGAAVYVDGAFAGKTPLNLAKLPAGDHRVRLVKDGYLENGRVVNVSAGSARNVDVKLTKFDGPAATHVASAAPAAAADQGSFFTSPMFLIAAAAGGGAAAFFLLKKNKPPVAGTVSVTPAGSGMAGSTSFTIASTGASDPEGKTLTYDVDYGDASPHGSAASTTHTYAAAGTYTVKITVSDGKTAVTAPAATVTVLGNLAGAWSGGSEAEFGANIALALTQSGGTLGGTLQFSVGLSGNPLLLIGAATTSYPSTVTWSVGYTVTGLAGTFTTSFSGTSDGTTMVGTVTTTSAGFGTFTKPSQTFHR